MRGRHAPQRLLRAVEDAHHVDLQQPLHIRGVQVGHPCARPQHGGVVDQGRERSELAVHGGEHLRHLIGPTDVGVDGDGASAVGLDLRAQLAGRLGLGAIIHAHAVAARAQQARGRGADPAAGSGYDRDFSHAANLPPGGAPPCGTSIARAARTVVSRRSRSYRRDVAGKRSDDSTTCIAIPAHTPAGCHVPSFPSSAESEIVRSFRAPP